MLTLKPRSVPTCCWDQRGVVSHPHTHKRLIVDIVCLVGAVIIIVIIAVFVCLSVVLSNTTVC